jgi:hypothetical protein
LLSQFGMSCVIENERYEQLKRHDWSSWMNFLMRFLSKVLSNAIYWVGNRVKKPIKSIHSRIHPQPISRQLSWQTVNDVCTSHTQYRIYILLYKFVYNWHECHGFCEKLYCDCCSFLKLSYKTYFYVTPTPYIICWLVYTERQWSKLI